MNQATILFGSTMGNTRQAAEQIQTLLGGKLIEVAYATQEDFEHAELLVLGVSTWGEGELQDDWLTALPVFEKANLEGKCIAVFGLGDQVSYPDTFVDAMGVLAEMASAQGATLIGKTPTDGYDFIASVAAKDGWFAGLVLDEDNQGDLSDERIRNWVDQLKAELAD